MEGEGENALQWVMLSHRLCTYEPCPSAYVDSVNGEVNYQPPELCINPLNFNLYNLCNYIIHILVYIIFLLSRDS